MFAFLDGEVSVERNLELLQHVNVCPPCGRRLEAEKRFEEGLDRVLAAEAPPAGLRARLDAALDRADAGAEEAPRPAGRRLRFPGGRWGFLAAAASLLAGAVLAADRLCLGPFQCPVLIAATQAADGLEGGRGSKEPASLEDAPDLSAAGFRKITCCSVVTAPRLDLGASAAEYESPSGRVALVSMVVGEHDPKPGNIERDPAGRTWYVARVGDRRVRGWKEGGVFRALVTRSERVDLEVLALLVRGK
jgi:hypothetical protein